MNVGNKLFVFFSLLLYTHFAVNVLLLLLFYESHLLRASSVRSIRDTRTRAYKHIICKRAYIFIILINRRTTYAQFCEFCGSKKKKKLHIVSAIERTKEKGHSISRRRL